MGATIRFGLLTVIGRDPIRPRYRLCRCDCGTEKAVRADHLQSGKIVSCGCERSRRSSDRAHVMHAANTKTGLSGSPTYQAWLGMKQRCTNPKSRYFGYYGGRGIKVCDRWLHSFENFLADMGERPSPEHTLDRYPDNDGNYEPGNCRWATRTEQQLNRRNNRLITHEGVTQTVAEWAQATGIHKNTIAQRLGAGLSPAEILDPKLRRDLSGLTLGGLANGARQRAKTHCKHGHPFDAANTGMSKAGTRVCRACRRIKAARDRKARRVNHSPSPVPAP